MKFILLESCFFILILFTFKIDSHEQNKNIHLLNACYSNCYSINKYEDKTSHVICGFCHLFSHLFKPYEQTVAKAEFLNEDLTEISSSFQDIEYFNDQMDFNAILNYPKEDFGSFMDFMQEALRNSIGNFIKNPIQTSKNELNQNIDSLKDNINHFKSDFQQKLSFLSANLSKLFASNITHSLNFDLAHIRLKNLEQKFIESNKKIDLIETNFSLIKKQMENLRNFVNNLDLRFKTIENLVKEKNSSKVENNVNDKLTNLTLLFNHFLEKNIINFTSLNDTSKNLTNLNLAINETSKKIFEVESKIKTLQLKIDQFQEISFHKNLPIKRIRNSKRNKTSRSTKIIITHKNETRLLDYFFHSILNFKSLFTNCIFGINKTSIIVFDSLILNQSKMIKHVVKQKSNKTYIDHLKIHYKLLNSKCLMKKSKIKEFEKNKTLNETISKNQSRTYFDFFKIYFENSLCLCKPKNSTKKFNKSNLLISIERYSYKGSIEKCGIFDNLTLTNSSLRTNETKSNNREIGTTELSFDDKKTVTNQINIIFKMNLTNKSINFGYLVKFYHYLNKTLLKCNRKSFGLKTNKPVNKSIETKLIQTNGFKNFCEVSEILNYENYSRPISSINFQVKINEKKANKLNKIDYLEFYLKTKNEMCYAKVKKQKTNKTLKSFSKLEKINLNISETKSTELNLKKAIDQNIMNKSKLNLFQRDFNNKSINFRYFINLIKKNLKMCNLKRFKLNSSISNNKTLNETKNNLESKTLETNVTKQEIPKVPQQTKVDKELKSESIVEPPIKCKNNYKSDCYEFYKLGYLKNIPINIKPKTKPDCEPVKVFCDMRSGGYTVIMKRINGEIGFYRNWTEYKLGFGNPAKEYWIGNDMLFYLTSQTNYSLKIELEDWNGEVKIATYDKFEVKSEKEGYKLLVNGYQGNAGDSFSVHNGKLFSTYDVDNDEAPIDFWKGNCAERFHGAWWYSACYRSNLNGRYYKNGIVKPKMNDGISWNSWHGVKYSLKSVEMKIRRNFRKN